MADPDVRQLEETIQSLKAELRRVQRQLDRRNISLEEERKRWELASPSREQLDYALSLIPAVVWAVNREGKITQFQGAGLDPLDLAGGEVYGQSIRDVFQDAPEMGAALERALRGETFSERLSLRHHVVDCHFTPQWNSEQDLIGVRGVILVVDAFADPALSPSFSAEDGAFPTPALPQPGDLVNGQINGQNSPLESLVKYLPGYFLSVVRDGTILFINRTIPPLAVEDVVGSSIYDFVNPDRTEEIERGLKRAFETGETVDLEVESHDPDGQRRIYACRLGPYKPAEEVVSVMVIARDVTALREMEELEHKRERDLEHLSRVATMAEMVAIMAHYLNNPLAAISNYAARLHPAFEGGRCDHRPNARSPTGHRRAMQPGQRLHPAAAELFAKTRAAPKRNGPDGRNHRRHQAHRSRNARQRFERPPGTRNQISLRVWGRPANRTGTGLPFAQCRGRDEAARIWHDHVRRSRFRIEALPGNLDPGASPVCQGGDGVRHRLRPGFDAGIRRTNF